jgi:hypothetical protein
MDNMCPEEEDGKVYQKQTKSAHSENDYAEAII